MQDWTWTDRKWMTGHWDIETHIFKHNVSKSVYPRRSRQSQYAWSHQRHTPGPVRCRWHNIRAYRRVNASNAVTAGTLLEQADNELSVRVSSWQDKTTTASTTTMTHACPRLRRSLCCAGCCCCCCCDRCHITPSGGFGTFSWGSSGSHGFWSGTFSRNSYRSPTTNHTMQVFDSDA